MNKIERYTPDESGYLSQEDTKSYYSRIGLFCFILGTISFIVSHVIGLVISLFFADILINDFVVSIINHALSFVSIYCIAAPLAFIAIKPLPTARPIKEKFKFTHLLGTICVCFAAIQIGSSFSSTLTTIINTILGRTLENPVQEILSSGGLLLNALLVGIFFPILEELLFRRLLCNKLLPLGEKQAVIISAAMFGLIHGNLFQFAYAFLLGLVFGYIYVKTGKVIYPIILHCICNLYSGVFAQYVLTQIPLEKLEEILNEIISNPALASDFDALWALISPFAFGIALYMVYAYVLMGLAFAGYIVLIISFIKRKITLEQGILQVRKENLLANFFLNGGVAAAIGYIVFTFLYSIVA